MLFILTVLFLISCETPYKITETYTTDSTGKTIKTVQKLYSDGSSVPVYQGSFNVITSPLMFGTYVRPYYVAPIYVPRVYVNRGRRH